MRTSLPVLLVLASGCASLGAKDSRRAVASMEELRSGAVAACGSINRIGGDPWKAGRKEQPKASLTERIAPSGVEACARFDPALRAEASQGSVLQVRLTFELEDERYLPEHWHVELVEQNGLVEYAGGLGAGRTEAGECVMGICTTEGYATVLLPETWRPGRYKVRLVHVPTQTRADLGFELR